MELFGFTQTVTMVGCFVGWTYSLWIISKAKYCLDHGNMDGLLWFHEFVYLEVRFRILDVVTFCVWIVWTGPCYAMVKLCGVFCCARFSLWMKLSCDDFWLCNAGLLIIVMTVMQNLVYGSILVNVWVVSVAWPHGALACVLQPCFHVVW